jgi:LysR family transcriptional regulator, glycine cleavage system transcriptional activator
VDTLKGKSRAYAPPRRLPPAHALTAIDAVASLGSLVKAAEYLGITRSAVSHRLALLENALGFDVVKRCGRNGIKLTPRGRRYAEGVHKALAILCEAQCRSDV